MKRLASLKRVLSRNWLKQTAQPGHQEDLVKTEPSVGPSSNLAYSPLDQPLLKLYQAMDLAG